MSTFKAILAFLWKRDSESAACLCVDLANRMTTRDLGNITAYGEALLLTKAADIVHPGEIWVTTEQYFDIGREYVMRLNGWRPGMPEPRIHIVDSRFLAVGGTE